MKRALLIAGGTVGGLGAVLSITPPHLGSSAMTNLAGLPSASTNSGTAATPQATASQTPVASTASATSASSPTKAKVKAQATVKATAKKVVKAKTIKKSSTASSSHTTSSSSVAATTPTATPTPTHTTTPTPTPAVKAVTGTFTGNAVNVGYGIVQVRITVDNGHITDAQAIQTPTGRSDRYSNYAVPILRQQTIKANSAKITGASGASYTSYGWYTSLVDALSKAGM
ncbi:MAG: hypothetical protein F2704_00140 [Actinobacteria bacterium]|uniref:Unannotated protein n=1 Tax=freshwater metagenome TaxID=449393 RepID=A0A6J7HDN1_9ZZZZ|nr:hypothetical protein [Actinomycetota bacterium]MSW47176.1 hypothetical protein [Actinomycetota bacterium]MSX24279.1 hypothetical protein [Actinomycetota bacterium]MSY46160.1 hypothetical protein [Actinomycetota bacterium]MSY56662.1 hypothetical protein [Actinomycetota bacterium]